MRNLTKEVSNLNIGDYVLVKIDGESTWINVIRIIGKNEILGIPIYPETPIKNGNYPQVRVFKQSVLSHEKLKDWKDPEFFTWLAKNKII